MSTKNKILDAAEKLFATQGFNGTSLREITSQAERAFTSFRIIASEYMRTR